MNMNMVGIIIPTTFIFLLVVITTESSSNCTRSCHGNDVQYPFGFSDSCEIRLNCSKTTKGFNIGEYEVIKVTPDNISVNISDKCNRPIASLKPLFSQLNFGLTSQNGFLLQNCTSEPKGCVIPKTLMDTQFVNSSCASSSHCYNKENNSTSTFLEFNDLINSSCESVFSSVVAEGKNGLVSLEFGTVHLEWWLEGRCNCSSNASCTNFTSPFNPLLVYRCKCNDGFHGDGYPAGNGCKRDSTNCGPSQYLGGQCGGTARIGVLIGGVIVGACLVTGLAFLCYLMRQRSALIRTKESTRKLLSEAGGGLSVPFYSYKAIERATYCFSDKYRLGTGAYGTVYAGKLQNDEWVAIKKIRFGERDGVEPIMNEIKLISSVNHPNLVHLLGFCLEKGEQILVYEFMPNGTLAQHLQRERGTGLPWTIRLNIATETAHAIAHLHSAMDPPIYHRDIKSSNILLDFNFNSKVADFGLSRLGMPESSHISTAPQGTPGYLDPQYHQNFHLSDKSDVYSLGVVLVEIITAKKVVDFSRSQSEVNLAALAIEKIGKGCLDEIIDPFLEPGRDAWTLASIHKMAELAFRCMAFHRDMRPTMIEVADELEQIKRSGWAPLEETICATPHLSSPSIRSEKPLNIMVKKEVEMENQRIGSTKEMNDWSPVSVNVPWPSQQSSPSTNNFSGNATQ